MFMLQTEGWARVVPPPDRNWSLTTRACLNSRRTILISLTIPATCFSTMNFRACWPQIEKNWSSLPPRRSKASARAPTFRRTEKILPTMWSWLMDLRSSGTTADWQPPRHHPHPLYFNPKPHPPLCPPGLGGGRESEFNRVNHSAWTFKIDFQV